MTATPHGPHAPVRADLADPAAPAAGDPVSPGRPRDATRVLIADVLDSARAASPRRGDAAVLAARIAAQLADTDPVHPAAREVLPELLAGVCRHCGDEVRRHQRLGFWVHAGPESHGDTYCPWGAVREDLRDRVLRLRDYVRCVQPEVEFAARAGDPAHAALRARLVLARTLHACLSESLVTRPLHS